MGCHVPPRVTYWTGNWNPGREAISSEISLLRNSLGAASVVVACSTRERVGVNASHRVLRIPASPWTYQPVASVVERFGDVTHIFGGLDSWYPLRFLGRRPMIVTLVTAGSPLASALLDPVAVWVAEADHLADDARTAGIPTERIRVIRPGVNLELFRPSPVPDGPFKVLFASSPQAAEEFEARGVNLLVDAARLLPDVRFVFAWRHWGNQHELRAAIDALSPPPNVEINVADVPVMATVYASVHAVAALFAPGHGKSAANSIIEGLACGRPALVSQSSGLANLLRESAAGTVVSRTPEAVAEGITQLRAHYGIAVKRARSLAESHFDQAAFVTGYLRTYDAIANRAW